MVAEGTEAQVRAALTEIIDPETGLNVMRMDLIHDLEVSSEGTVSLVFRPSSPVCPMAYSLANAIKKGLLAISGVTAVSMKIENFERAAHLESLLQSITNRVQGKEV